MKYSGLQGAKGCIMCSNHSFSLKNLHPLCPLKQCNGQPKAVLCFFQAQFTSSFPLGKSMISAQDRSFWRELHGCKLMLQETGRVMHICRRKSLHKKGSQVQLIVWMEQTRNSLQGVGMWKATWFSLLHPQLSNLGLCHPNICPTLLPRFTVGIVPDRNKRQANKEPFQASSVTSYSINQENKFGWIFLTFLCLFLFSASVQEPGEVLQF